MSYKLLQMNRYETMRTYLLGFLLFFGGYALGQSPWVPLEESAVFSDETPMEVVSKDEVLRLNIDQMKSLLAEAPQESGDIHAGNSLRLSLPLPSGKMEQFQVVKYDAIHPDLVEKFPSLQCYRGTTKDGRKSARLVFTQNGLNVFLRDGEKHGSIARKYADIEDVYHSYYHDDILMPFGVTPSGLRCELDGHTQKVFLENEENSMTPLELRQETYDLRVYRLAVTVTGEWANSTVFGGGTVQGALDAIAIIVNQLNELYERDVALRFELIADNDELIFLDPLDDPFQNGNPGDLTSQGTTVISGIVGLNSFDVGHVFGTNAGGLASLGSVCGFNKGGGSSSNFGAYFSTLFYHIVAHELGHQLSATHTFNWCEGDNETASTAYEPGSGSTIMSYAGASNCENRYIENVSDAYFHNNSINRMIDFIRTDIGNNCGENIRTDNTAPEAYHNYEDGFYIPINTPFILDGGATDAEGDNLTYCWEQYNLGPLSSLGNPLLNAPSFRSFPPTTDSFRVFPRWNQIFFGASNFNEVLPSISRDMNFRITVRDNNEEVGLVDWDEVEFEATASAGPFQVLSPLANEIVTANSYYEVRWDVANTDGPLVNTQAVDIYLSDGGSDFDVLLADNVPNNGLYFVEMPNTANGDGRIMVRSADNIFFNVTDEFNIEESMVAGFDFAPSDSEVVICLPEDGELELRTSSILGFDGNLEMELLSSLPNGVVHSFENAQTEAGEDNFLLLEFDEFDTNETFDVVVRCFAPGVDTIDRIIQVRTVSSNFSDMLTVGPSDGEEGVSINPQFSWSGSVNANSYTIEIATNPSFDESSLVELASGISGNSFSLSSSLEENQVYFWRIIGENECGSGAATTIASFHTLNLDCAEYQSQDVPISISASGAPTRESIIEVPSGSNISDVNIPNINMTHQNIGHITMTLISPEEDEVVLVNQQCFFFTNHSRGYDDESPDPYDCTLTSDGKIYQPAGQLSDFQGEDAAGIWTLQIRDNLPGSGGTLNSWNLEICGNIQLNPPSLVRNDTLFVPLPFSTETVTNSELRADDPNTPDDEIQFILTSIPEFGNLELGGTVLDVGDGFSQQDIDDNSILYDHISNDTIIDGFDFIVLDGEGGYIGGNRFIISTGNAVSAENVVSREPLARLYPNPAANEIFVSPIDNQHIDRIEIHNTQGQLVQVYSQSFHTTQKLALESVQPGVYFVTVYSAQRRYTDRIVVQK